MLLFVDYHLAVRIEAVLTGGKQTVCPGCPDTVGAVLYCLQGRIDVVVITFFIFYDIFRCITMNYIPILIVDNWH